MKANLPAQVQQELVLLAQKYDVAKLVLFGSRARGSHQPKSDIDLAVYGCRDFLNFSFDVDEKTWTLLTYDIIDMEQNVSPELVREIKRDGVTLYEKIC